MEGLQTSASQHLEWCIQQSLEYYDQGDKDNALGSFLSDVAKHDGTACLQNASTLLILQSAISECRDAFETAMLDFAV